MICVLLAECATDSENWSVAIISVAGFAFLGFIVWLGLR